MKSNILRLPAALLGCTALASLVAAGPASAQEVRHNVRTEHHYAHRYTPHNYEARHYAARHHIVVRREVRPRYAYGYGPGAAAGNVVAGAGQAATDIVGGAGALAAGLVGGVLGGYDCAYSYPSAAYPGAYCPAYGYYGTGWYDYGYPGYAYGYGYPYAY